MSDHPLRSKPFPIQGEWKRGYNGKHPGAACSWADAERAYVEYARQFGTSQSLERLAERGGFGRSEMDMLAPGWTEVPRG